MSSKARTIPIFIGINKNGDLRMFSTMPVRDEETGTWRSNHPFINSVMYEEFLKVVKQSNMTWESEPELFNVQINEQ